MHRLVYERLPVFNDFIALQMVGKPKVLAIFLLQYEKHMLQIYSVKIAWLSQSCVDLIFHFWSWKLYHLMLLCYRKISRSFQRCFSVIDQTDGVSKHVPPPLFIVVLRLHLVFLFSSLSSTLPRSMMWFSLATWSVIALWGILFFGPEWMFACRLFPLRIWALSIACRIASWSRLRRFEGMIYMEFHRHNLPF